MKKLIVLIAALMLFVHSSAFAGAASADSIIYNEDKSITVYGTVKGEYEEFGICINPDEKSDDFSNAVRYKAYGEPDGQGRFGVVIPYSEFAADGVFSLKVYTVLQDGSVIYSENTLNADAEREYSRMPFLKTAFPSEGEIYPALSPDVSEYYVLVDKMPENPLSIKYEAENSGDSVIYKEAKTVSDSVKIKLSSGYNEKTFSFSFRIRKKARLYPSKYFVQAEGKHVSTAGGIAAGSVNVNYIMLDTSVIPEKYIPAKAVCGIKGTDGKNVRVAVCTEPFMDTKNWGNVESYYSPQTGEFTNSILTSSGTLVDMDEKDFPTRSSLKLAIQAEDGAEVSGLFMDLEYFENVAVASKNDITLSVAGANEVYPAFNPGVYEYYAVFDRLPGKVPEVSFVTGNPDAAVSIVPATDINGETVAVISLNGRKATYKIRFREYKEAEMKLNALTGKRTPYELYTMKVPNNSAAAPYHSAVGRMENEYGTSHSHLAAMAFDTSGITEKNIHISTAELNIFATTNCTEGVYVDLYRCTNTSWTESSDGRAFFATANHFVPKGAEGKLNGETLIKYIGGNTKPTHYRYYSIPLNTIGFKDAKSINLYLLTRWQSINPPNATYQSAYVWMGMSGLETYHGIGIIPTVYIRYFVK